MTDDPMLDEIEDPTLAAFRGEVRAWLDENAPMSWQDRFNGATDEDREAFLAEYRARLHSGGYLVPHSPKEFGGGGFSSAEQLILKHELRRAGYPPVGAGIAFHHVAATLIKHGTAKQQEVLERILMAKSGAKASPNPTPAPTWRRCRPAPCAMAAST